ncbi:class I adenylate-forming enzyme family protein [Nakamurella endophytica]|uniref:Long-chain fatty acid--CoA ligase n=1 Tax=Nakamurella endophytica TaxID=1748367 RepID=A0A917SMJ4_9ACTN|nr:AMP-binding protein [Nakamurella endophytica]GGL88252.1 hypothetical protein GCM10011594_04840 [Nakamurella endophytica]
MLARGPADAPALTWRGRTLRYTDLAVAADRQRARWRDAPPPRPVDLSGCDVPELLAGILAATAEAVPVLVADPAGPAPAVGPLPAGTWLMAGTSGSTGRPRTVARTLASWTDSFPALAALAGLTATDTVLLTGPLHSTLHLFGALHTLWLGARLTDRPAEATAAHAVPTVLDRLLSGSAPRLSRAVVAGAALPDAVSDRAAARGVRVLEYYGAAELSFVAARTPPAPFRPFPGVQVQDQDGVLWARSPYLALGMPAAAGGRPTGSHRLADGWATVGDRGTVGPDGTVTVAGRGDTAVTVGGATVPVEEVEDVLRGLPGVEDAAVAGAPHGALGQVVVAAVCLVDPVRLAAVRTAARRGLRAEARPVRWVVLDRIPRRANGKVDRVALSGLLAEGPGSASHRSPAAGRVAR